MDWKFSRKYLWICYINMPYKPKTKPMMKKNTKALMKEHSLHHTKKHMDEMRKLMKRGITFNEAHNATMKKIGK